MSRGKVNAPEARASALPAKQWMAWLGWLGLLLVCFAVYAPALHGNFLWDDSAHVTRLDLRSLEGLGRIWFELGATQQYYPVLHSAFWVEHQIWGDAVFGYHAWNVLLHTIAAGLIVVLMRRLKIRGAWLAGFLFALHPLSVESVAWISEQKNTLSTVFYLLALLAYLRFDQLRPAGETKQSAASQLWRYYALASVLFVFAALSKTVTVTLPAALLVILWWQRGKLTRRDFLPLLPWFAFSIAAGLMTAWVERTIIGASGEAFDLNLWQRVLLAGQVAWFYFGKLLWPANLMFIYPRWDLTVATFGQYLGLIAALAVLILFWKLRHRSRGPLATALLFVGTLFPALGFFNVFPFQFSYVADHFQYLASIAIFVAASAALTKLASRYLINPWWRSALAVGLLITLGGLSRQEAHHYRDNITLYRTALEKNPACWLASYNLGMELFDIGQTDEAIALYHQTLRLKPDYAEVHANLGMALASIPGRLPEAILELQKAVQLKPELLVAKINLGNLLSSVPARRTEAIPLYEEVLRHNPAHAQVRFNLGLVLFEIPGRENEALLQFETAAKLKPDYWQAHYQVGTILMRQQRELDRAITAFETVITLNPDYAEAHFKLAQLLLVTPGHRAEAIAQLKQTLKLNPHHAGAHDILNQVSY